MIGFPAKRSGFTIVEVLVVVGIVSLLTSIAIPSLNAAKERARATKVHAELYGLGVALEMYGYDNDGDYPPVRVNCNTDMRDHWCQLPVELAQEGYVDEGPEGTGLAAEVEDEFNPGHTYKYAKPGPGLLNGAPGYEHEMWIPSDFPECREETGHYVGAPAASPVEWVVWSLGPDPESDKSTSPYTPLRADTWYKHAGDTGIVVRFATKEGRYIKSP